MASKDQKIASDFTAYYLQQSTKEFAEDLDKIRGADDFKGDALPMLIKSLQQGTSMFSAVDQKRIVEARGAGTGSSHESIEDLRSWGRCCCAARYHSTAVAADVILRICIDSQLHGLIDCHFTWPREHE
ncbi:ribosome-assembly protein 3-domain-containing protein [Xylaria sp. FL0064]|nr:ribosome-assembly protein 3-domain-containing protein [Xylaria sp. FL0064]